MSRSAVPLRVPVLLVVGVIALAPSCAQDEPSDDIADTGEPEACDDITEEAACDATETCAWDGVCHLHCPRFEDEASCMAQPICFWLDNSCDYGAV